MYNEGRVVQLEQAKRRSRFDTFSSGGSVTTTVVDAVDAAPLTK